MTLRNWSFKGWDLVKQLSHLYSFKDPLVGTFTCLDNSVQLTEGETETHIKGDRVTVQDHIPFHHALFRYPETAGPGCIRVYILIAFSPHYCFPG